MKGQTFAHQQLLALLHGILQAVKLYFIFQLF